MPRLAPPPHLLRRVVDRWARRAVAAAVALYSVGSGNAGYAQLTVVDFPSDLELIPRAGNAATATLELQGTTTDLSVETVTAVVSDSAGVVDRVSTSVTRGTGSPTWELSVDVPVARVNHRLELFVDDREGAVRTAEDIVAGDVYLVNGQSNAEAGVFLEEVDYDPFTRGFNPAGGPAIPRFTAGWHLLQNTYGGLWPGRMAKRLSNELDLPIAVVNYGRGGKSLRHFFPGADEGLYEELVGGLAEAGLLGGIRNLLWFQGEADGFAGTTTASYRRRLETLLDLYRDSLGIEQVYAFQTRPYSCGGETPYVMEAQRRIAEDRPGFVLLASTNFAMDRDECHYVYEGGRDLQGERMADLLFDREYGLPRPGATGPRIDSARVTGSNEVTLYFDTDGVGLAATGRPWPGFVLGGSYRTAVVGRISGDRLVLSFTGDIRDATGISYRPTLGPGDAYLHNRNDVGALTFYDVSLLPGDGAPGSYTDVELRLASDTTAEFAVGEILLTELTLVNAGTRTAEELLVSVPVPAGLTLLNTNSERSGFETYYPELGRWAVERLRPDSDYTLQLRYEVTDADSPTTLYAQVMDARREDLDSRVASGDSLTAVVTEDDEARIVFGDRARDCDLAVNVLTSACLDSRERWDLRLASTADPTSALTLDTDVPAALVAASADALDLKIAVDALNDNRRATFSATWTLDGDASCRNVRDFAIPDDCSSTVSVSAPADEAALRYYPNPVAGGALLTVEVPAATADARVTVLDARGALVHSSRSGGRTSFTLPAPQRPGVYVLTYGDTARRFVVQ